MGLILTLLVSALSWGHQVPTEPQPAAPTTHYKPILVLGNFHSSSIFDVVPTVTTLEGDALVRKRGMSLGETLKNEVGVNATSYGPTASRPVIRGLEGDRIRILQNGIGVLDASGASQDHAVPLDTLSAESIEIVRGPINLLYGSSAIGGVVNITNARIHEDFTEGFFGAVDTQGTSVNSGQSYAAKFDYGISQWMFHVDGSINKTADLKVPGYVRSEDLRKTTPLNPEAQDKVPNSASESANVAAGTTYVGDWGYFGASVSTFKNEYGVVAEPNVLVDMNQLRLDVAGELKHVGPFKALRIKSAQSVYNHQEVADGVAGTTFKNNGNESRIELVQKESGNLSGLIGTQLNFFKFSALGNEAFLPVTDNSSFAVFVFEELNLDAIKWNVGARAELSAIEPEAGGAFTETERKSFETASVSLGGLYSLTAHLATGLNLSYNERAPTFQELFAGGPHVATFSFQQGDPTLQKESSLAAEWSLRHQSKAVTGTFNIFGQRFTDFIALVPSGTFNDTDGNGVVDGSGDDLPIYNYRAQNANIYGAEIDLHVPFAFVCPGEWGFQIKGDYVRGKNRDSGENLPRFSPPRASIGIAHKIHNWTSDSEVQQVFTQKETAPNETPTDGYLQTNFGISYKFSEKSHQTTLFGRVNNIFDVEARNHVSFLKDVSQVGGRNFVFGIRGYF